MPKVSGVDFSGIKRVRDTASIILMDGSTVELPLLPTRHADEGLVLLQRNDMLASRYAVVQSKLKLKAEALEEIKTNLTKDGSKLDDIVTNDQLDVFEDTYASMQELHCKTAELCKESNKLCDEIIKFISPFVDAEIIAQLKQLEDRCTVTVLELMLYGSNAVLDNEELKSEENPTTQASQ